MEALEIAESAAEQAERYQQTAKRGGRLQGPAVMPARPLAASCSTFGGGRSDLGDLVTSGGRPRGCTGGQDARVGEAVRRCATCTASSPTARTRSRATASCASWPPPPTPERMTAVLAQVHEVIPDPALAACLQLSLAGPHLAPGSPSAPPPMTLSAFGMNLHAATTADGRDRKQPRANLPLPPAPTLRP